MVMDDGRLDAAKKQRLTTAIFSRMYKAACCVYRPRVDIINEYLFLARFHRSSFSGYAYPTRAHTRIQKKIKLRYIV